MRRNATQRIMPRLLPPHWQLTNITTSTKVLGALIAAASVRSALGHAACVDALPVPHGVSPQFRSFIAMYRDGGSVGWFVGVAALLFRQIKILTTPNNTKIRSIRGVKPWGRRQRARPSSS